MQVIGGGPVGMFGAGDGVVPGVVALFSPFEDLSLQVPIDAEVLLRPVLAGRASVAAVLSGEARFDRAVSGRARTSSAVSGDPGVAPAVGGSPIVRPKRPGE